MAHFLVYQGQTDRTVLQCFNADMNAGEAEALAFEMFPKVPTGTTPPLTYTTRALNASELETVEAMKAAGNMPKKGTGTEITSETFATWKAAMELDYPEMFEVPT